MRRRGPIAFALTLSLVVAALIGGAGAGSCASGTGAPVSTPPPTPVPPFGSPSPFPTALVTPSPAPRAPRLGARAAILEDLDTGQVLFERAARSRRPVASVTKVMTALLVLEKLSPGDVVTAGRDATGQTGSKLGLAAGERITVRNLLYALLLQSSNDAAVALADAVAGSVPRFVELMNERAGELGLRDTRFASPNGLDDRGYSSATDLAAMTREAYGHSLFAQIVRTKTWNIPAPSGPSRHIQNRNALLWLYPGAIGVKTGFTSPAGRCIIATGGRGETRVLAVVLGEPGEPFDDAATLLNYGLLEFVRVTLIRLGESVGTVDVQGSPVPAVAGADLSALVRRDLLGAVGRRLLGASGLTLPVAVGAPVGTEVSSVAGSPLGSVPAVAATSVPAPGPAPTALSEHPLAALIRLLRALLRAVLQPFL